MTGAARAAEDPLLEFARRRLFDTAVACTLGLNLPEAQAFRPLLGSGTQSSIQALVAATRATEVDDIAISGCVTPGSVVVPVALVCAAESGLPLTTLLDSMVDGYEAMIATAEAIDGARVVYRGIWPTLAAAPAGAVVTAGRLMGMKPTAIRSALVRSTIATTVRPEPGGSRWRQLGIAAAEAVAVCRREAVQTEDANALEAWANAQQFDYVPARTAAAMAAITRVDTKPFPTARQGLAAICAFRRLLDRQPLSQEDNVVVTVPSIYAAMIGGIGMPTHRIQSLLQVSYQIALAALAPDRLYDVAREHLLIGTQFARFLQRVSIVASPDLDRLYPTNWAGSVTFDAHTGADADRREMVRDPEGSAVAGFDWRELANKAARLAQANGIAPERFVALENLIRNAGSPSAILEVIVER